MDGINRPVIDAIPQRLPVINNENASNKIKIEDLLKEFCAEDFKSAFFLLMDYIEIEEFLSLTKKDETFLSSYFIELYNRRINSELLFELLGTLKMYKKLRTYVGSCSHVFESQGKKLSKIHGLWKVLYSLCEELTDDDLEILKQHVHSDFKDQILSTEDWFCWALQNRLFSRTDLSNLENMFKNYPSCLNIIKSYKDFLLYDVRIPTTVSNCGIALILNYDKFDETSGLEKREYSNKDVTSLRLLWETFGFNVVVLPNLTSSETFKKLEYYASSEIDHSNYDIFVCCILSHGQSNSVYSYDGILMETSKLLSPIVNCKGLNKKPKLFFIQACQGTNIHQGIGKPIIRLNPHEAPVMECNKLSEPLVLCDVLIVNSSIDGYVSFRDKEGSWFIQTLCKRMMQDGENSSVEEVMAEVSEEVRNKYFCNLEPIGQSNAFQIVSRKSTLGKKLILKRRTKCQFQISK